VGFLSTQRYLTYILAATCFSLQVEIYTMEVNSTVVSGVNFHCIYFHVKMVLRLKHVAAKE
jgi:hypothetical protein